VNIENTWIFPALEAAHVVGLAMLVGSVVVRSFDGGSVKRIERVGLNLMVATGIPMWWTGADRYHENPAFFVKMLLVLAAVLVRPPRLSLALWALAVFAGRAVIDFDA
jgi:hypothetical protein